MFSLKIFAYLDEGKKTKIVIYRFDIQDQNSLIFKNIFSFSIIITPEYLLIYLYSLEPFIKSTI